MSEEEFKKLLMLEDAKKSVMSSLAQLLVVLRELDFSQETESICSILGEVYVETTGCQDLLIRRFLEKTENVEMLKMLK